MHWQILFRAVELLIRISYIKELIFICDKIIYKKSIQQCYSSSLGELVWYLRTFFFRIIVFKQLKVIWMLEGHTAQYKARRSNTCKLWCVKYGMIESHLDDQLTILWQGISFLCITRKHFTIERILFLSFWNGICTV